jgi:hypothetical protein
MKIHLKKVLVSLLIIVGFVFYAMYQRYFSAQQALAAEGSPDTVADLNTSETVTTTTVNQAETVPPAVNQAETVPPTYTPETFTGIGIGDDDEHRAPLLQQLLRQQETQQQRLQRQQARRLQAALLQPRPQFPQLPQPDSSKTASMTVMLQMLIMDWCR